MVRRGPPGLDALPKLLLYTLTLYGMSGSVSVMCPVAHTTNSEVKSLPALSHPVSAGWRQRSRCVGVCRWHLYAFKSLCSHLPLDSQRQENASNATES